MPWNCVVEVLICHSFSCSVLCSRQKSDFPWYVNQPLCWSCPWGRSYSLPSPQETWGVCTICIPQKWPLVGGGPLSVRPRSSVLPRTAWCWVRIGLPSPPSCDLDKDSDGVLLTLACPSGAPAVGLSRRTWLSKDPLNCPCQGPAKSVRMTAPSHQALQPGQLWFLSCHHF